METYTHKRGDTLSLAGTVSLPAGTWTATCKVKRPSGSALETLAVTLDPGSPVHAILIEASSAQTADWVSGETALCDVRFSDGSVSPPVVIHSPTFGIRVQQEIAGV